MNVVLVATYECGHQPFGLASPAAWLVEVGARVTCVDLTRSPLDEAAVSAADLVAFHVPMHTATRLAVEVVPDVRRLNPNVELCFFGLYAPANAELLTGLGAVAVIGGEFEVVAAGRGARRHRPAGGRRRPAHRGPRFLERGDPCSAHRAGDASPAPRRELRRDNQVEHLLRDARHLAALADTGCLFVTTAVEPFDDEVLRRLAKGHTTADFGRALGLLRQHGLAVHPTFIPFHPWTTPRDYAAFLERIAAYDLVASVAPIQLALRLLVPAGSLLLDLPEMAAVLCPFDAGRLVFPWRHPDPEVDALHAAVLETVTAGECEGRSREETFDAVWRLAGLGSQHDGQTPPRRPAACRTCSNPGSAAPNRRP